MKINKFIIAVASALAIVGCSHKEDDGLDHHDHHEHAEEGHDHEAEGEGHDHEHAEEGHDHGDEIHLSVAQAKQFGVQTETLAPGAFNEVITVSGQIVPQSSDQSVASATASGIFRLAGNLNVGDRVSAGQSIGSVSAQNIQGGNPSEPLKVAVEAAKRELDRITPLRSEGIVSEKEYNDARERYEQALADYNAAAKGGGVTAPTSGVISQLMVRSGEYVATGQPVAVISANTRLTLRADVPEKYYNFLPTVSTANFRPDYSDHALSLASMGGRLVSSPATAMARGGYIPVYFSFNSNGQTVPGAFAEIYLIGATKAGALSVPIEAVVEIQGNHYVYTREHDDAYAKHLVELGNSNGQRVEVLSGLPAGEKVVVKGAQVIRMAEIGNTAPPGHTHNH